MHNHSLHGGAVPNGSICESTIKNGLNVLSSLRSVKLISEVEKSQTTILII